MDKNLQEEAVNMNELALVVVVIALVLVGAGAFFILGSVPKSQYDTLKASCDKTAADAALVPGLKQQVDFSAQSLSDCTTQKKAEQSLADSKDAEIASLRNDSLTLSQAREKAGMYQQYAILLQYYNDGFGPQSVLNYEKLGAINSQLASINDPGITSLFQAINSCDTLLNCQSTKAAFTGAITTRMSLLANETTGIVESG